LFRLSASPGGSAIVAEMEPGVIVEIARCDGRFCEVYAGSRKGWAPQKDLWGVYPGEKVN
jgi:SH3-like domain-containing protein